GAGEIFSSPSRTFSVLNNADLTFPVVKNEEGEDVRLSHGLYGQLIESTNRSVREEAFKSLYEVYDGVKNTFASTLSVNVWVHNYNAKVHHYDSARAQALAANYIPESVHETLLDVVGSHLHLLHRYMELRKKLLNVDELHMYDLYTPITGEASLKYTYEEAKEETLQGLEPLGEDYRKILESSFADRWIDVQENI